MDTLQQYFLQEQPQPDWRGGCTAPTLLRRARFNLPLWTSGKRSFRVDFVTIVTHNVKYKWWYIVFVFSFIHSDNNFSQTFAYLAFLYIWTNLTTVEVIKNLLYLKHISFSLVGSLLTFWTLWILLDLTINQHLSSLFGTTLLLGEFLKWYLKNI